MQRASPLPPLFSSLGCVVLTLSPCLSSLLCSLPPSFPPLCSFSADVWRALHHWGDEDSSVLATGGKEQTLCLENGKMVRSLNVARGGPPIDRLRTRLAEYLRVIVLHRRRWDSRARSRISMCFVFGLAVPESAAQLRRQQAEGRRWGKGLLLVCLVVIYTEI